MTNEELFRALYRIRAVEEEVARVYPSDKIQSPIHLSIGQELASVAVCAALAPADKVFGSYRSHALYLAKGGDLKAFVAELYGRVTGCCKGKGGSMHLAEASAGLLGTSAIVASLIPVAVGYAWAQKLKNTGLVTACFFGDGATEEGCYFEALNFAALHQIPILFVCENNGYAIHTPLDDRQSEPIVPKVRSFGILEDVAVNLDSTIDMATGMVKRIRKSGGPCFLEVLAPRLKEHVGIGEDWALGYRDRPFSFASAKTFPPHGSWKDPVDEAGKRMPSEIREMIEADVRAEVAEAFAFAEASAAPGPEELMRDLYG